MTATIILATRSAIRATLLRNAGVEFIQHSARIDERAVEATVSDTGASPADLAEILASAKAEEVSARYPDALVIGCDQTLSLDEEVLHKCTDPDDARRRLLQLSGRTHELNSAVAIARRGETTWRTVVVARMTARTLTPQFIGRHLARTGSAVLDSVGAYQIEGEGVQLFDSIDGDYFTIAGLPLLPLLGELRRMGAIDG